MVINTITYFLDFGSLPRHIPSNSEGTNVTRESIPHPPVAGRAEGPGAAQPAIYVTVSRRDPRPDRVARGPGGREYGHRRTPGSAPPRGEQVAQALLRGTTAGAGGASPHRSADGFFPLGWSRR